MKLLLTSASLTNESIINCLRGLLGKPTKESIITVIPTAHNAEVGDKGWMLEEDLLLPYQMDWKKFNVVELAASASLDRDMWWSQLEEADVLLVGGGNTFYLSYWMQKAGLFESIPKWLDSKVYVGISAGSQIVGAHLGATSEALTHQAAFQDEDYDELGPIGQSSGETLKLVDFIFRPHLNSSHFPKIRLPYLEQVAHALDVPMYAIDDQSAIRVVDNKIDVISEGQWQKFTPGT